MAEEKNETLEEKNKLFKAKTLSLISKIIGVVVILGGHVLKWLGKLPNAESSEIIACGFSVMAIFGTVDINIMLDKFTKKE